MVLDPSNSGTDCCTSERTLFILTISFVEYTALSSSPCFQDVSRLLQGVRVIYPRTWPLRDKGSLSLTTTPVCRGNLPILPLRPAETSLPNSQPTFFISGTKTTKSKSSKGIVPIGHIFTESFPRSQVS